MKKAFLCLVVVVFFTSPAYCGIGGLAKEEMVLIKNQYLVVRLNEVKPYGRATDSFLGWKKQLEFCFPKIMLRNKHITLATDKTWPWMVGGSGFLVLFFIGAILIWPSKKKANC